MDEKELKKRLGNDFEKIKDLVKKLTGGDPDAIHEALKVKFPKTSITSDDIHILVPTRR